ncbi:MAG: xylulokinase [Clostridia bacterium]|nr:xylulokinase [Clostridia bacterium]
MLYIGIDLGTSAVKLLLVDEKGNILNTVTKEYPLIFPKDGWSEQNPADWWEGTMSALSEITEDIDKSLIKGIGVAGQMHGLVILDENDEVIRPAILWNDGRTEKEVEYLNNIIGKEKLSQYTANIAFAGFTGPKILWVKENEPENFKKIRKIMLPKDYINYKLTGVHACDYSDASGMLLLDVKNRCWSKEMLGICSVTEDMMPRLFESSEVIGEVKEEFGFPCAKVVAGAGDNAAAAIGTGTVGNGKCNISLGTSGTVFISSESFGVDSFNALHSFCHADGNFHLMGCMLSAASCNKWFSEEILKENDFLELQKDITEEMLGNNSIYFLPYLMGERSPINDTDARGVFLGLSLDTKREDMLLAVLEGVSFAIRDSFEVAKSLGLNIEESCLCGGGAKSPLWRKILSNILGIKLNILKTEQGPGFGGAVLSMVGTGEYSTVKEACEALTEISEVITPDERLASLYEERYNKYKQIYPALKGVFKNIR